MKPETMVLQRRFSAWSLICACGLSLLVPQSGARASEPEPAQFVGMYSGSPIILTLTKSPDQTATGKFEQSWIDAAGRRKSGTADVRGTLHDDVVRLYLMPKTVMLLPLVLTMRRMETGFSIEPALARLTGEAGRLKPGNDADYREAAAHLPKAVTPAQPGGPSLLEHLNAAGIGEGEGCQCGEQKKTSAAEATIAFAEQTANLLADLQDYQAGIEISRHLLRSSSFAEDQDMRQSRDAFSIVFQKAGREIERQLTEAAQRCSHRPLAEADITTREAKLWRNTCRSVVDGLDLYRATENVVPN